jgi:hypothetical protein
MSIGAPWACVHGVSGSMHAWDGCISACDILYYYMVIAAESVPVFSSSSTTSFCVFLKCDYNFLSLCAEL